MIDYGNIYKEVASKNCMKRRSGAVFSLLLFVCLLSVGIVSAGWFGDTWASITGNVIVVSDGLIAYYDFNEGVGDQSGNGNDGVSRGSVDFISGKSGDALLLDGSTGYVEIESDEVRVNEHSLVAWVKFNDQGKDQTIISNEGVGHAAGYDLSYSASGRIIYKIMTGGMSGVGYYSTYSDYSPDSDWHFVVGTYDGSISRLYIDGSLVASDVHGITIFHSRNVLIGGRPDWTTGVARYFDGLIDEVRIYDRALSGGEIGELYSFGEDGLLGGYSNATINVTCVDSDGGWDYYTKGNVSGVNASGVNYAYQDSCLSSSYVTEYYCDGDSFTLTDWYCPNGCSNGACVEGSDEGNSCANYTYGSPHAPLYHSGSYDNSWGHSKGICVQVLSPNGGQIYSVGDLVEIKWKQQNIDGISLSLSSGTNQGSWIEMGLDNLSSGEYQSYLWNISKTYPAQFNDPSWNYTIKIIGLNSTYGGSVVDGSDDFFKILESNTVVDSCQSAIDFMASPTNLTIDNGVWKLKYSDFNDYPGEDYYYANLERRDDNGYDRAYVNFEILDSDNTHRSTEQMLASSLENGLCEQENVYMNDEDTQIVYVCRSIWDLANDAQDALEEDWAERNEIDVIWINDNKMFRIGFYSVDYSSNNCDTYEECLAQENRRHREQQIDIAETLGKLIDNEKEYVGGFYLSGNTREFVKYFLDMCDSDAEEDEEYVGSWRCRLEPVVCPPHGRQSEICTRWNSNLDKEEMREASISCNPGICAGCFIPRWEGSNENVCIPYGTRLNFEENEEFRLMMDDYFREELEEEAGIYFDVDPSEDFITVRLNSSGLQYESITDFARIYVNGREYFEGDSGDFYLYNDLNIVLEEKDGDNREEYKIRIIDLIYDTDRNKQEIEFKFIEEFPAYCDIDGEIRQQKDNSLGAAWAKCQNNYECASNICSYGECVDLRGIVNEAKGIRAFFTKIGCRLRFLFDNDDYNQCLWDNLGEGDSPSSSGSGSSGGSSGGSSSS